MFRLGRAAFTGVEHFIGRLTVHRFVIAPGQRRQGYQRATFSHAQGADARLRWGDQHPLHHGGRALFLQRADQGFTDTQLGQHRQAVERGVGAKAIGHGPERLLLFCGERTQPMLDAQAQLGQHGIWQVTWRLRDEVDPHALGANQPYHLLQAVLQCLGRAVEQQMRFIEEQRQYRLVGIATFRQLFEQFGQQPQQEGRIHLRRLVHQPAGIEQMDTPTAVTAGAQQVF
ncbi:hypothetical protein D3C81_1277380 [compost metagenome]